MHIRFDFFSLLVMIADAYSRKTRLSEDMHENT